jgi:alanyl-tRNA synthetase
MIINHRQLRKIFFDFWKERDHKELPPASLTPQNDPTTLFTGSGMQQLVPYLLGEIHPLGKRLFNIQPCFRSQDIQEVGDNRHTTFFEMMGNWSLGDYFKKEQIKWVWEFFTKKLSLPKEKLYISYFAGDKKNNIPEDKETYQIWLEMGVKKNHIFKYGPEKNWWSRAGEPSLMPEGEPGGPDTEVFYDFGEKWRFHENSPYKNQPCHPNCNCGRFLEIGNSVFMQYYKKNNQFQFLPNKNVDFGGGLERILASLNDNPDVFLTDVYLPIIETIEKTTKTNYLDYKSQPKIRIIADHLKASVFLINDGVLPSNKERGYFLRRLLRRVTMKVFQLKNTGININDLKPIIEQTVDIYQDLYFKKGDADKIYSVVKEEIEKFKLTLNRGLKILDKMNQPTGKDVFNLYQSYGFPKELTEEILKEKGIKFDQDEFNKEFEKHRQLSRQASIGIFKGGLADHSEKTLKYHTATHLIHQALFDVFGDDIKQAGSHITSERLRFDFYSQKKIEKDDLKKVEVIVNQKIKEALPVNFIVLPKDEAYKIGAKSFFKEKYPNMVKVYFIGNNINNAYSKEFCGGPHVKNTKEIGSIKIFKFEKIGANTYRIYAK